MLSLTFDVEPQLLSGKMNVDDVFEVLDDIVIRGLNVPLQLNELETFYVDCGKTLRRTDGDDYGLFEKAKAWISKIKEGEEIGSSSSSSSEDGSE